jgi:hypothetical protein
MRALPTFLKHHHRLIFILLHQLSNCTSHYCRYKRDYYINDDEVRQLYLPSPPTSTPTTPPVKQIMPTTFEENNEDKIVPSKKKTYEEMTVSMLIEDVEVPAKYTRHDQDFSLTISEDSETTRIYTPSTQEMKLIAPHAERISTTKGIPVAVVTIDESEIVKIDDGRAMSVSIKERESLGIEFFDDFLFFFFLLTG